MVLLPSGCREKSLQVGYMKNLQQRLRTYRTHNPMLTCVGAMEGTKGSEKLLHLLFRRERVYTEWFRFTDENRELLTRLFW